jgi:hypothetical protein
MPNSRYQHGYDFCRDFEIAALRCMCTRARNIPFVYLSGLALSGALNELFSSYLWALTDEIGDADAVFRCLCRSRLPQTTTEQGSYMVRSCETFCLPALTPIIKSHRSEQLAEHE